MGATVTCGQRAAAFRTAEGNVIYILFESTYEKNCFPHTPHESAVAFGDTGTVLKRIFRYGSACEGGMLQGKGGAILPENYIARWLEALRTPVEFNAEQVVTLRIGGYHSLDADRLDEIIATVHAVGDAEAADQLASGLNVRRQVGSPTVLAIMALGIMPWRLDLEFPYGRVAEDLGYHPAPSRTSPVELPKVAQLQPNADRCFVLGSAGWTGGRGDYCFMERFIESLHDNERHYPGTYRNLIRNYRAALKAAPVFSGDAVVRFTDPAPDANNYVRSEHQRVIEGIGIASPTSVQLDTILPKLEDRSLTYAFYECCWQGLITIDHNAPLLERSVAGPVLTVPKPTAGMVVSLGGVSYKLVAPLGARKGWQVQRIADGVPFRMPSKHLAHALRSIAQQMFEAAKEKMAKAASLVAAQQQQQALF